MEGPSRDHPVFPQPAGTPPTIPGCSKPIQPSPAHFQGWSSHTSLGRGAAGRIQIQTCSNSYRGLHSYSSNFLQNAQKIRFQGQEAARPTPYLCQDCSLQNISLAQPGLGTQGITGQDERISAGNKISALHKPRQPSWRAVIGNASFSAKLESLSTVKFQESITENYYSCKTLTLLHVLKGASSQHICQGDIIMEDFFPLFLLLLF